MLPGRWCTDAQYFFILTKTHPHFLQPCDLIVEQSFSRCQLSFTGSCIAQKSVINKNDNCKKKKYPDFFFTSANIYDFPKVAEWLLDKPFFFTVHSFSVKQYSKWNSWFLSVWNKVFRYNSCLSCAKTEQFSSFQEPHTPHSPNTSFHPTKHITHLLGKLVKHLFCDDKWVWYEVLILQNIHMAI